MTILFEVVTESSDFDGKVTTMRQFVTQEHDSLLQVAKYFTDHCDQYDEVLKEVKDVASIVQHIKNSLESSETDAAGHGERSEGR